MKRVTKKGRSSVLLRFLLVGCYALAQIGLISLYHNYYNNYNNNNSNSNNEPSVAKHKFLAEKDSKGNKKASPVSELATKKADGFFNGYPVFKLESSSTTSTTLEGESLLSQFHCLGESWKPPTMHRRSKTWHEQSWMYRSCKFDLLCFDTQLEEYVIYLDPEKHLPAHQDHEYHHAPENDSLLHPSKGIQSILEKQRSQAEQQQQQTSDFKHPTYLDDTATIYRNHTTVTDGNGDVVIAEAMQYGVAIGSMNGKWGLVDGQRLKWFPQVRWGPISKEHEVYTLPASVVMIPFHSLSAVNPGHLVWDDFLPIFSLLDIFGFYDAAKANHSDNNNNDDAEDDDDDRWIRGRGNDIDILPIRYILPPNPANGDARGLWAGCDAREDRFAKCHKMLQKFGILLGSFRSYLKYHPSETKSMDRKKSASKLPKIPITTNRHYEFDLPKNRSSLVCARHGLAGFGALSDHGDGTRSHGWMEKDYQVTHNQGRGGQLWDFRNFLLENLFFQKHTKKHRYATSSTTIPSQETHHGNENSTIYSRGATKVYQENSTFDGIEQEDSFPPSTIYDWGPNEPLVVLFSAYSSETRGGSFQNEAEQLKRAIASKGGPSKALFGNETTNKDVEIVVEVHKFADYTIEKQIQMASRCAVYVTYCGGGAITATFLPRGASLQMHYSEAGGVEGNKQTGKPARLDWDYLNNLAYLHVHWIPSTASRSTTVSRGKQSSQADKNVEIILHELRRIHLERERYYRGLGQKTPL